MFYVEENRCTGCGACTEACPVGAITLQEGKAVIDQELCVECGSCLALCAADAIREVKIPVVPSKATVATIPRGSPVTSKKQNGYELQAKEGGGSMPNGFGFGRGGRGRGWGMGYGFGGGMGFGFRGSSPPWPYVGRGRGGLPRCGYFLSGAAGAPVAWPYQQTAYPASPGFSAGQAPYPSYGGAWPSHFYGGYPAPGATPYSPSMTREQELDFLKGQADAIKGQLEEIETRVKELEAREE